MNERDRVAAAAAPTSSRAPDRGQAGAPRLGLPFLGYGVGLRRPHFDAIVDHHPGVDFVEVLTENFMGFGGKRRTVLERAARTWPIVVHGVSLSIGSVDPLDEAYLASYAAFVRDVGGLWASDHISWSSAFGVDYHDLLPMPFTEEAVDHIAARVAEVKARLPVPFALENPSYYIAYGESRMTEAEFVREVVERADCGLLLDVNNVWVNARNHGFDPRAYIDRMPHDRVVQIHMAGHWDRGDVLIDTHGDHAIAEVLDLYAWTLERTGPVSTLFEWDNDIPPLDVLLRENDEVRAVGERILGAIAPDVLPAKAA